MQANSSSRTRRNSRGNEDNSAKRFHEGSSPSGMHFSGPYYPSQPYYHPASMPTQPYVLPYTQYQQPHFAYNQYGHSIPYHQMPPLKRPRTEMRINSTRLTPKKTTPVKSAPRKTFSDFRIHQITIGSWKADEVREESDVRDSRIRFCFRNSTDKDPSSTLSVTEAALVAPDRISISVHKGTRRIVIPAHHIKRVDFARKSGEIVVETDGWAAFESFSDSVQSTWQLTDEDLTNGQLARCKAIHITLDQEKPLTEPKWTRGHLEDYIDGNSRFLKVLHISDAEPLPSFDTVLERWAGNDSDRAYFCEYQLGPQRLLQILTNLMSSNNVLSRTITILLEDLVNLTQVSVPSQQLNSLIKSALFTVPENLLLKSLEQLYLTHATNSDHESELSTSASRLMIESALPGGSKRQRGESEVPSDQLAKATLDEKRRRLSMSGDAMEIIKDKAILLQSQQDPDEEDARDFCRLSREEMLTCLEALEDAEYESGA